MRRFFPFPLFCLGLAEVAPTPFVDLDPRKY